MIEKSSKKSLPSPPKKKSNKERKGKRNPRSSKPKRTLTTDNTQQKKAQNRLIRKTSRSHKKILQRPSAKVSNNNGKPLPPKKKSIQTLPKKKKSPSHKTTSPSQVNRRIAMGNPNKQAKGQSRSNSGSNRRASYPRKRFSPHRNDRSLPRPAPIWELSGFPKEYYEPVKRIEKTPPPPPPPQTTQISPTMERNTLPITKISKPVLCDVEFVALFLTPKAVQTLREFLVQTEMNSLPDYSVPPHVTLWFRPSAQQAAEYKNGKNCEVQIVGFAKHELIQAVQVELQDKSIAVENRIPHITISVQEEIPPWYSNGLLEMSAITKVVEGPVLQTVVGKRYRDGTTVTATVFKKDKFSFYDKLRTGGILQGKQNKISPSSDIFADPAIKEVGKTIVLEQGQKSLSEPTQQPHQSQMPAVLLSAVLRPKELNKPNVKKRPKVPQNSKKSPDNNVIKKHHRTPKALDTGKDDIIGEAGEVWKQIRKKRKKLAVDELRELLPTPYVAGKDFRIWPKQGLISMMFAKTGRTELVKYLVRDLGFNVNQQRPKDFCTMLHVAAYYEDVNMLMVQTLIDLGADPLIKNAYGEIPLVSKRVGKKHFSKIQKARGKQQIQQLAERLNKRKPSFRERKFRKPPPLPPSAEPIHCSDIFVPVIPPVIPLGRNLEANLSPLATPHNFYRPPPGTRPHPAKGKTRKRSKRKSKAAEQTSVIFLPITEKKNESVELKVADIKEAGEKAAEITSKPPEDTTFFRSNDNDSSSTLRLSTVSSPTLSLSLPGESVSACKPEVAENKTKVEDQSNKALATIETKSSSTSTQKLGKKIVLGKRNNVKRSRELFGDHRELNGAEHSRANTSNQKNSQKDVTFAEDLQFFDDLA